MKISSSTWETNRADSPPPSRQNPFAGARFDERPSSRDARPKSPGAGRIQVPAFRPTAAHHRPQSATQGREWLWGPPACSTRALGVLSSVTESS
jgi:hypothetical protein